MEMTLQDVLKILIALGVGGIVGLEREYRTKPAGFRTLILICVGSALFTMLSEKIGAPNNADRIASYILVGVGFIGSGTIFKEGLTISGITTAATIWLTAGLGMAVGNGNFLFALVVVAIVFTTLEVFARFDKIIDRFHSTHIVRISFKANEAVAEKLEAEFRTICPKMRRMTMRKDHDIISCTYKVEGGAVKFEALIKFLSGNSLILAFES